jgi:hypothetical protein
MLLTRAQSCSCRQIGSRHFATCAPGTSAMRHDCRKALGGCTFQHKTIRDACTQRDQSAPHLMQSRVLAFCSFPAR